MFGSGTVCTPPPRRQSNPASNICPAAATPAKSLSASLHVHHQRGEERSPDLWSLRRNQVLLSEPHPTECRGRKRHKSMHCGQATYPLAYSTTIAHALYSDDVFAWWEHLL